MSQTARPAMPDALVLLALVALLAWGVTHWVPAGQFLLSGEGGERQLVPGSFRVVESHSPVPLFAEQGQMGLANLLFEGLVAGSKWGSAVGVAAFLLVVGGAFGILLGSGSLDRAILAAIGRATRGQDLVLPGLFFLFSLAGAVFGMGEEAIAFCLILVPTLVRLGYDSLSAVACCYLATQLGFAASWMNPFSVALAQGIAAVPLLSGAPLRLALWAGLTALGMAFVWRHGRRVRAHPEASPTYHSDRHWRERAQAQSVAPLSHWDRLILLLTALGLAWVCWGVMARGYYLPQIAAQFFALALVVGVVARLGGLFPSLNDLSRHFSEGAAALVPAVLVVALAKGVVLVLGGDDPGAPSVLNTLLNGAGNAFGDLGQASAAALMFWFQSAFNLLVSSGSGQAALTMPLMAPLSDLLGLTRQVAVLAFQLGDGLTNVLIPTSAALVGCLGVARVSWGVWVRFVGGFMLMVMLLATAVVMAAAVMGYQ
ncbi:putative basic amino acid antiporter YfcC [Ferrimonas balearica]|uniref:putative basic amino acid antiporter YfcC n=1 Tax=Ferrimonas balearica TaxID=44012 RepID=UPI001C99AFA6|nr:putative basic amino acid antiporter YfcC [Ferrimonas balearica]MBY5991216.1 putative basic amino acid antiporter YfcC [Ferrimonas balearica]